MFNKILVANRGEIAIRVFRACRELGIDTVAIHSEADKHALHSMYADESYLVGPAPPSQSYLDMKAIIEVAEKSGAEAIHPGYGFLAENPDFPRQCEKSGITFIGPSGKVIELMGSKIDARKTMGKADIPLVPGSEGALEDLEKARDIAQKIGYPVVLKASAGGGGIGMKVAWSQEELERNFERTQSVARSAFGNPTIFIEKFLTNPRHIEFQVLGDSKGNMVHINERECSIQRRHQKLIEECPSPVVTPEMREEMGSKVVEASRSINYTNAGTMEFIYSEGNFYFLEMNTRLQVEHPITERTSGVDIVKEQIKIALGEEMGFGEEDINLWGHAIECRVNAEDPLNDFNPSPGKIKRYRSPGGPGVRLDSGVRMGYTISPHYDPMISKLICWGRNRGEAISRMDRALEEYLITGIKTNVAFHKAVMRNEAFKRGEVSTSFIQDTGVLDRVPRIMEESRRRESRLIESFREDKRLVAISSAVSSYMEQAKKKEEYEED